MRNSYSRIARWLPALAIVLGLSGLAQANSGSLLPLDEYQAGTEQVQNTIVTNGNFESVTGTQPNNWTLSPGSTFQAGTPTGPNTSVAVNGLKAAQGPLGNLQQRSELSQSVTLAPNTDYFLSGYLWNFSPLNYDLVLIELRDGDVTHTRTIALAPLDNTTGPLIDGSRGVFGSRSFNSGLFTGPVTVNIGFEYDAGVPGTRPSLAAQIDNVAITPANLFVPPRAVPEPASIGLLALAGVVAIRRRR